MRLKCAFFFFPLFFLVPGCTSPKSIPDAVVQQPQPGEVFEQFVHETPKQKDSCDDYQEFYTSTLARPISLKERQLISVFGDIYICVCRESASRPHEMKLQNEDLDTDCKLSVSREKYGVYSALARRYNERLNGGSVLDLTGYLHCAYDHLTGRIKSDVDFEMCLLRK